MMLAVDLGKTSCRAVVHGNPEEPVAVAGAPGLAAPGGVRAAERAVVAAARALGIDGIGEAVVGAAGGAGGPPPPRPARGAAARAAPPPPGARPPPPGAP